MDLPVADERLRTRYAEAPQVRFDVKGDVTVVTMAFNSSLLGPDRHYWVTEIRFIHVLDFGFKDFDLGLDLVNPDDFKYALIEVRESEIIRRFRETGALVRVASPVVNVDDLRHYRIAFDDHGTYDVVALGIEASEFYL